jgi:hypothetical protein
MIVTMPAVPPVPVIWPIIIIVRIIVTVIIVVLVRSVGIVGIITVITRSYIYTEALVGFCLTGHQENQSNRCQSRQKIHLHGKSNPLIV